MSEWHLLAQLVVGTLVLLWTVGTALLCLKAGALDNPQSRRDALEKAWRIYPQMLGLTLLFVLISPYLIAQEIRWRLG